MSDNKIIYIPGWMDRAEYAGFGPDLDIWGSKISYEDKIDADVVVAHSLGCHFALLNWQQHKNVKLVLVNPLLGRRSLAAWLLAWVKFFLIEGRKHANPQRVVLFFQFFFKLPLSCRLLKTDIDQIITLMSLEDVVVVRGKNDQYFCNLESLEQARKMGVEILEIEQMGHAWSKDLIENLLEDKLSNLSKQ